MPKEKHKQEPRAVNQYPHNLHKYTLVTDRNSFEAKGERYLLNGDTVINIRTGEIFPTDWQIVRDYFL